jgi:hypothetical protein
MWTQARTLSSSTSIRSTNSRATDSTVALPSPSDRASSRTVLPAEGGDDLPRLIAEA